MGKYNIFMPLKYKKRFERWDAEKVKAILLAMFEYKETGEVTNLPSEYYDAFESIMDDMDIIEEAYQHRCEINAENGKKGGRPKKSEETEKSEWVFENRKKRKNPIREEKRREEKKREEKEDDKQGFSPPFSPYKRINDIKCIGDIL